MAENQKPDPLTEDQLHLVDGWIEHAANTAAARVSKRALAGFLILLVGLGIAFYTQGSDSSAGRKATVNSGRAVAVDGCNRDFRDKDDFRGLLIRLKVANDTTFKTTATAFKAGKLTPGAYATAVKGHDAAVTFYNEALARQKYPDCGNARSIVTDDPSKTIVVPRPLTKDDAANADIAAASKRISKGG